MLDPLLALFSLPAEASSSSSPSVSAPASVIKGSQSVTSLLQQKKRETPFLSGCSAFDGLLGSSETPGLPRGSLLELSGCPGEGKTRICVSYAVNACLSQEAKEKHPRVLIIGRAGRVLRKSPLKLDNSDTQGSISIQSLHEAAQATFSDDEEAGKQYLVIREMH